MEQRAPRSVLCRMGRHSYVAHRDENPERKGQPYYACVRCGVWYESDEPELDIEKFARNSDLLGGGAF